MDKKFYQKSNAIHMQNYVYNFHFHLVWTTKYRHKVFTNRRLVNEMKYLLLYIAKKNGITIEAMEVMPDHIHLMLSFRPKLSATNAVRALKGESALMFLYKHPSLKKQYFWGSHLWSHSYYMGTVGDMSQAIVKKYIADQYPTARQKKRAIHLLSQGQKTSHSN